MSPRIPRPLRAVAATMAAAAYALPLAIGLMADVGHGVHHLVDEVREHRRMAAALGLVHLHEARTPAAPRAPGGFVHSHGGAEHSHDAATDALLVAAAQVDEGSDDGRAPTVKLSSHVPVSAVVAEPPSPQTASPRLSAAPVASLPGVAPTPPPPRA